ncbi:MAG: phytanoyl-CoA dioxygenase family protein [Fimbriimonadaceae bacterium]|nr:phytanoyl-CoA dioxygenase family protein [Fimbriimonadaceae bacterium]
MASVGTPLTPPQVRHFETFGFLACRGLLSDCIARITAEFEAVWAARGGGHDGRPHDGTARSCIVPFIDQSEYLCTLLDHPAILGIGAALLGDDFNYMGSDGNYYVGDTGWHSDGWHHEGRHLKMAIYLDPVTATTGCLRVIPGSHQVDGPFSSELHALGQAGEQWGLRGSEVPAVPLESTPGDLLVFNHNLKHAAFGGGQRRRMFTINLCQRYPNDRLPALRDYLSGHARFWIDRAYGETMLRTAGPERRRHLEQVAANDGHLAELSRLAREQMTEPSRG